MALTMQELVAAGLARRPYAPRGISGYRVHGMYGLGATQLSASEQAKAAAMPQINQLSAAIQSVQSSLSQAQSANPNVDYTVAAAALGQAQSAAAQLAAQIQSAPATPFNPNVPPQEGARLTAQQNQEAQAIQALVAQIPQIQNQIQGVPSQVSAITAGARRASDAEAQARRDAQAAADRAAAQAASDRAAQQAALDAESARQAAIAKAGADAAAANAAARRDALQAQLDARKAEIDAQRSASSETTSAQSTSDQAAMQFELQRLQQQDAEQQRQEAMQSSRDQQTLLLTLLTKMPQLAPQILPSLIGPGAGAPGAYGQAQDPGGVDMSYGHACDPSVDPACGSGQPMFGPATQGPAPPPVVGDDGSAMFGNQMFGMGGLGRFTRRGMRGLGGLAPAPAPLPQGSQLEAGYGAVVDQSSGFYVIVDPNGNKVASLSPTQANTPGVAIPTPDGSGILYTSPSGGGVVAGASQVTSMLLPFAQLAAQTYTQSDQTKAALKAGRLPGFQPAPPPVQQPKSPGTGTVLGTIGILGAVGAGLWWLSQQRKAVVRTNPRRRRRARRSR